MAVDPDVLTITDGLAARLSALENAPVGDVREYGAVGDRSTDDTIAIQAALDAAETAGGGLVRQSGVSLITAPINVPNKVRYVGTGRNSSGVIAGRSFVGSQLVRLGKGDGIVFGSTIEHMSVDSDDVAAKGVYSSEINELSGIFHCLITGHTSIGIHIETSGAQNWSIDTVEVYGASRGCTDNILIDGAASQNTLMRITTNMNGGGRCTNGLHLDNGAQVSILQLHTEKSTNGVFFDGGALGTIVNLVGHPSITNLVNIGADSGGGIQLFGISKNSATNSILNSASGQTNTDPYISFYSFSNQGTGAGAGKNLIHSQNSPPLRTAALSNFVGGMSTKTKAGTPSDADFTDTPIDGTLVVDIAANRLWVRIGPDTWKWAALS